MSDVDTVDTTGPAGEVPFDLRAAADTLLVVAGRVREDQLELPTPCADWPVRTLLAHLCGLVPAFTETARHRPAGAPPAVPTLSVDWRDRLPADLATLVHAWQQPAAWVGDAEAGGVRMPAAVLATVALDELVVHTADLAAATGQPLAADPGDVRVARQFAEQAAAAPVPGLFAPPTSVSDTASPLAQLLALTGRDPAWRPAPQVPLAAFLGDWSAEGTSYGGDAQSPAEPHASASPWRSVHSARWHSGHHFVLQDERAAGPFDTFSVLGWDADAGRYFARTVENHGFTRDYTLTVDGDIWTFSGAQERATCAFSADGRTQTVRWQRLRDGHWLPLCDRVATRVA